jgi:hypothetical protein
MACGISASAFAAAIDGGAACRGGFETRPVPQPGAIAMQKTRRGVRPGFYQILSDYFIYRESQLNAIRISGG